jgi:hypothetical protein
MAGNENKLEKLKSEGEFHDQRDAEGISSQGTVKGSAGWGLAARRAYLVFF